MPDSEQDRIAAHLARIDQAGREAWAQATAEQVARLRRLFRYGQPPAEADQPPQPAE